MTLQLASLDWTLAVVVAALGGFATGTAGFGFALVTTPVLLWVLPPPLIVVTNLAVSVVLRVPLLWVDRSHIVRSQAVLLAGGGLVGMPLGLFALTRVDTRVLTISAETIVIVLCSAYLLGAARVPRLPDRTGVARVLVGLGCGALNTSVSLSGPPMVLWLLNQRLVARPFRATVSAVGLVLNFVGVSVLIRVGAAEVSWLVVAAASVPAAALGTWFGHMVLHRLPQRVFVRGVALFVIACSVAGIALAW